MNKIVLFNHIPRSGGTTLRIILNRVYGEEKLFFIKSKDIAGSLEEFLSEMISEPEPNYKVISGHGAELFCELCSNPFKLTILREPLSMFISQYHYLKASPNSNFQEEVRALESFEDYVKYAINNGQDNMLCRMLSGDHRWLITKEYTDMETKGAEMVEQAKGVLQSYDAILDLNHFDAGVYALSTVLGWPKIPVYRRANSSKNTSPGISSKSMLRLKHHLRFDIELYEFFRKTELDIANYNNKNSLMYKSFLLRQWGLNKAAILLIKR